MENGDLEGHSDNIDVMAGNTSVETPSTGEMMSDSWEVAQNRVSDSAKGYTHVLDLIGDLAQPVGPRDMSTSQQ